MHRMIGYISKRFAQIRPGEGRKVWLTFLYFFLVIMAYYVIKPVSRSLVLHQLGHKDVPYADLITVICMGPFVTLFARLVDRLRKPVLVSMTFWGVAAVMLVFWKLMASPQTWLATVFYVWVSVFSVLVVTLFWLVANDLYRPREAKRLFGLIGSGGLLGGIVGSYVSAAGAQVIGTRNLLLISTGLLLACWMVVQQLWHYMPETSAASGERPSLANKKHDTFLSDIKGFFDLIIKSRYLVLLIGIVGLGKIVSTFIYYQFNPFIEETFLTLDAKTTFASLFNLWVNAAALVIQVVMTSWVLRRLGLLWALLLLPLGLLVGSLGLLVLPLFWLAAGTEMFDRSMSYSLHNVSKEMLYLPIDRTIRYKVKPFIDMVVFRFGKGIAAITAIFLLNGLGLPAQYLGFVTVPLIAVWLITVFYMREEYVSTIRTMLKAKAVYQGPQEKPPILKGQATGGNGSADWGSLITVGASGKKLDLINRLLEGAGHTGDVQMVLDEMRRYEEPLDELSPLASHEIDQLKQTIHDLKAPLSVRRHCVRQLTHWHTDQDTIDYLCGLLLVEQETVMRYEVGRELVRMRVEQFTLQFPVAQIRRQIAREVKHYGHIGKVEAIYRRHSYGSATNGDPVIALLSVLREESVEQIFRLLILLYRPEDIHLIFEQMRSNDIHLRSDAIELLDNLIDPALRSVMFPIIDEDHFLIKDKEDWQGVSEPTEAYRVLQEAIWDQNCWLSVTTLCAIGRLKLRVMRQELEKASAQAAPLIARAARVALHVASF